MPMSILFTLIQSLCLKSADCCDPKLLKIRFYCIVQHMMVLLHNVYAFVSFAWFIRLKLMVVSLIYYGICIWVMWCMWPLYYVNEQ